MSDSDRSCSCDFSSCPLSMDIHQVLRQRYDAYNDLYEENLDATQDLQHTLIHDILPGLVDELGWDTDKVRFARDWLEDTRTS